HELERSQPTAEIGRQEESERAAQLAVDGARIEVALAREEIARLDPTVSLERDSEGGERLQPREPLDRARTESEGGTRGSGADRADHAALSEKAALDRGRQRPAAPSAAREVVTVAARRESRDLEEPQRHRARLVVVQPRQARDHDRVQPIADLAL